MNYQHICLDYLESMTGGDTELRYTLLNLVKQEVEEAVPTMKTALKDKDWHTLQTISHKLKATLAFVGNQQMIKANERILISLEKQQYEATFLSWLNVMDQQMALVLGELQQELQPPNVT